MPPGKTMHCSPYIHDHLMEVLADERLGNPPSRWFQEPLVVRDRDGRPPRGPSGSALLLCV